MSCSNCFNGCAEIVSDKCVKYTGVDIPKLGIETGDPLLVVENKITEKVLTLMDGSGIFPVLEPADVCALVKSFMPCCPPFNLNVVLTAFVKTMCVLDSRLTITEQKLAALNADYTIGCLEGVTASADTHEIVQATINKACETEADLVEVAADLASNYVPINQLDALVKGIVSSAEGLNKYHTRMVPYTAVAYWGDLTDLTNPTNNFDTTGAGHGVWDQIYLCNGDNNTPDLRGRAVVGTTTPIGLKSLDGAVAPGGFNPNYTIGTKAGTNSVLLDIASLPTHAHGATISITDPGHYHTVTGSAASGGIAGGQLYVAALASPITSALLKIGTLSAPQGAYQDTKTNLRGDNHPVVAERNVKVTVQDNGEGKAHANNQPTIALYYIMYIPTP